MYQLSSSANVSIVRRTLVKKELIEIEKRQAVIPDPIMVVWLKRKPGASSFSRINQFAGMEKCWLSLAAWWLMAGCVRGIKYRFCGLQNRFLLIRICPFVYKFFNKLNMVTAIKQFGKNLLSNCVDM